MKAHRARSHVRQLQLEPRSVPLFLQANVEAVAEQAFVAKERVHGFSERAGHGNLMTDDAEGPDADLLAEKEPESRLGGSIERGFQELLVSRDVERAFSVAFESVRADDLGNFEPGEIEGACDSTSEK
jgi:hypothetical protein